MAIAFASVAKHPGSHRQVVDVTLDGSYGAGGYAVTGANFGVIGDPTAVECSFATANGLVAHYDTTNKKIKIYKSAGSAAAMTEVSSGDLTSSVVLRTVVFGTPVL